MAKVSGFAGPAFSVTTQLDQTALRGHKQETNVAASSDTAFAEISGRLDFIHAP